MMKHGKNLGFDLKMINHEKSFQIFMFLLGGTQVDNILSIAWLELFLMAEAGMKVKTCRKCGNYYDSLAA